MVQYLPYLCETLGLILSNNNNSNDNNDQIKSTVLLVTLDEALYCLHYPQNTFHRAGLALSPPSSLHSPASVNLNVAASLLVEFLFPLGHLCDYPLGLGFTCRIYVIFSLYLTTFQPGQVAVVAYSPSMSSPHLTVTHSSPVWGPHSLA